MLRNSLIGISALFATTFGAIADDRTPVEIWKDAPMTVFNASDISLSDFSWLARPIIIFANTEADPRVMEQIAFLNAVPEEVITRDIVIIVDTDATNLTELRTEFRPRGFQFVLIGKDGEVKLRKPRPWDIRELSRVIDKMPMRKQEMRAE